MRGVVKRVTPSMVIALVALGVALSGSSIAATVKDAIDGSEVARNSLPGNRVEKGSLPANRIARNALTGRQIDESRLAQVPKAGLAADATMLGGQPPGAYRMFAASPSRPG